MRPSDLPDFKNPPLNEVALGVQFVTPKSYQQIRSGEVWSLFKADFPDVQEVAPLPPMFETFGVPSAPQVSFGFLTTPPQTRFWFLSESGNELIQFQPDRLHHNWRKLPDGDNAYPRFESMISNFERELLAFEKHFCENDDAELSVSQCEISYVNHIASGQGHNQSAEEWLQFLNLERIKPEDFRATFRRIIHGNDSRPIGRLSCEAGSALGAKGDAIIVLNITARGLPKQPNIRSALDFLTFGREQIVRLFAEVTTPAAHKAWERVQ